jgi:hypothetical protein
MNISTRYLNETTGAQVEVVTDSTDTYVEQSMVFTKEEVELGREGTKLSGKETNALFALYAAQHNVVRRMS